MRLGLNTDDIDKESVMAPVRHMANLTKNNRRLARFYSLIFGMNELWNEWQNSSAAFYITDGYLNFNCLEILPVMSRPASVRIDHIGFMISKQECERKLAALDKPIKLEQSPQDGRYEDWRFEDPEGNLVEIAARGWGTESNTKLPLLRHTTIHAQDHERLAEFYEFVFDMKEVHRKDIPKTNTKAIYLSDGNFSIALVKNSPIEAKGFQVLGFHVQSIAEIEERLKKSPPFLYPREPKVEILRRTSDSPFKEHYLHDPDGNIVDLSEEGWEV